IDGRIDGSGARTARGRRTRAPLVFASLVASPAIRQNHGLLNLCSLPVPTATVKTQPATSELPPATEAKVPPAMQRYLEVKAQYPQPILLFRIGDFYELFYEDAQTAAKVLGLTLTSRDKGSTNPIPMAGFPYHQLDNYLRRLIQAGFRAAVCEQVEDPALAKGLVKREVTRVVTPGTLTEAPLLDPPETNFLPPASAEPHH